MKNFVAIDFETANQRRSSVCSVGIVIVKNGKIVDSFYSLIHPIPNYYAPCCQMVHGLSDRDTRNAPEFPEVWKKIKEKIGDLPLVAHNATFDKSCLKAVYESYCMDYPEYTFYDTLKAARITFGCSLPNHQLHTVASACGYDLRDHHHALADAEAAAHIAMKILDE